MNEAAELELRSVLHAQSLLLRRLEAASDRIDRSLADTRDQAVRLRGLEAMMLEIEQECDRLPREALDEFEPDEIQSLYVRSIAESGGTIPAIRYVDWASFVFACQAYTLHAGLDPYGSLDALLTEADIKHLRDEFYGAQYRWDEWDYVFVGTAGVLASLTDFLLVALPKAMPSYSSFFGQNGSPITAWLRQLDTTKGTDWYSEWARELEKRCRVPYDAQSLAGEHIGGMAGRTHRFQSLGHDPVLGFVFGVVDIMRGTITGFSYDRIAQAHTLVSRATGAEPVPLVEAMLKHVGHLVSDACTPAGLPSPLMPLAQLVNVGSFGKGQRTVAEVARYMYLQGYDLRHFITMGITPAVIEIILRAYIMLRHYFEKGELTAFVATDPKYRAMLLAAHAIAATGNAGKLCLMGGNPLAFNQAQWLALFR